MDSDASLGECRRARDMVVRSGAVGLAVRMWGGGARCVVLVHGYGTNSLSWLRLVSGLEDDFTVVAYDRRGHGRSSGADSYAIENLAGDVRAVVDGLGLVRPVLVGHSVGAWDALAFAADEPNVAGVLCLDQAIAVDDAAWSTTYRPVCVEERLAQLRADPLLARGYTQAEVDELILDAKRAPGLQPWSAYGPMVRRGIRRGGDGLFWVRPTVGDRLMIERGWATVVAEPYEAISCPVTLALAARNPGPFHDALRRLAVRRKLSAVLLDSDHDIHVERPGDVADLVRTLG
ncbi:alpha/beta fold hydrolase [Actinopolymorpha rutila]|uniref:Pimeloyl-ACP methyl ester carboxylesterase n=1 Tax=Actinopolymorpha rutila TaxID=446787 RepID=A0A852ZIL5_9ACTN|nr:alpha/beta hydrolase [Actinopolymorpha rutila]NYH92897.1 pimeloyl-ACP methyl ester carboxylesterase [Actinopolymorpha rutila]